MFINKILLFSGYTFLLTTSTVKCHTYRPTDLIAVISIVFLPYDVYFAYLGGLQFDFRVSMCYLTGACHTSIYNPSVSFVHY